MAGLRLLTLVRSSPKAEPTRDEPALDDTELIAAVRRGDASAATALYTRARPQAERTISSLLRRGHGGYEDLVQLTMIELVRSLDRFRGDCSLDTWIARIAARTLWKQLRKERNAERALARVEEIAASERSPDLERELTDRDVVARVRKHLEAIDPVKAWTVMLHDVCGYDLREISEITGAGVAAAQSRLVRGRAELHARIARDPELRDALRSKEKAP